MKTVILLLSFALSLSLFAKTEHEVKKVAKDVAKKVEHKVQKVEHKAEGHKAEGHKAHKVETKKINFVKKEGVTTRHNENVKAERLLPFVDAKYNSSIIKGGQVFSKLKVSESHMNIKDKKNKNHVFDIHSAKNVGCAKCHISKPTQNAKETGYLNRLNILLDKGSVDNYLGLKHNSVKGFEVKSCISCHEKEAADHSKWLPATEAHFKKISCETCHINKKDMFTAQSFNYGLVDSKTEPFISYIGGNKDEITGFTADLIWFKGKTDKLAKLKPAKMVSFIVWVDKAKGDKAFVDNNLLKKAFYNAGRLKPEVLKAFDSNKDKKVSAKEAQIDSDSKKTVLSALLKKSGVKEPVLKMISLPIALEHNVMAKESATKNCESCHSKRDNSILYNNMTILDYKLATDNIDVIMPNVKDTKFAKVVDGKIVLDKEKLPKDHFMMLTDTNSPFDTLFIYLLIATILALLGHGLLRIMFASKRNGSK